MKKIKILFQGDSITDDNREEMGDGLGIGYVWFVARMLPQKYPDIEFEFVNRGVSGNETKDLLDRLDADFIEVSPDIVSILVGVNDVWHYAEKNEILPNEKFEENYRSILQAIKDRTHAKILMIEPFLFPHEHRHSMRGDLDEKINIVRRLALEYADAYLPLDGILYSYYVGKEESELSPDGIHPEYVLGPFIADAYCRALKPIIEKLR